MVISPFRDAARQLLASHHPQLVHGTVHTAQGKEAEVVLYVVGNHGNWAKLPHFNVLSRESPVRVLRSETRATANLINGGGDVAG